MKQCATVLGCVDSTIIHYLEKYNIPSRKTWESRTRIRIPKKELERLYIGQKYSLTQCAKYFCCDHHIIMSRLEEYGIPRRNISEANKDKCFLGEHKIKISEALKGRIPWNKGLTAEDDLRIPSGNRRHNWKGGTSGTKRKREMCRSKYATWRREVLERDKFTCVICEKVGGRLNVHHIESWVDCPERRYDIDNGITLCEDCHKNVHRDEIDCLEYFKESIVE